MKIKEIKQRFITYVIFMSMICVPYAGIQKNDDNILLNAAFFTTCGLFGIVWRGFTKLIFD